MENKYYIPEISELYVGFEYEEYNQYRDKWCKKILTKKDLESLGSFMYNFLESFESDNIRVKYLDKSDIESFGFVCVGENSDGFEFQNEINDYLFYDIYFDPTNDNEVIIEKFYQTKLVAHKTNEYSSTTVFNGKIKNKPELKKVLQMIGVI